MIKRYQSDKMNELWSLKNRFSKFLEVELASLYALKEKRVITEKDYDKLLKTRFELDEILKKEKTLKHDVLAFIEVCRESLGEEKKYFHYGLTSTDVVDSSNSLLIKAANNIIEERLENLLNVVKKKIQDTKEVPIMARTHGMYAEISTLGMRFYRFFESLNRVIMNFKNSRKQIEVIKLSGAVGTYSILDDEHEELVRKKLGLFKSKGSSQVLSRDRHSNYLNCLTNLACIIEGLAIDIRLLSRSDVSELNEGFSKFQKGSSAMPHKKNPITSENLTGLARMMRGYMSMSYENIALWHERDISHSSVERVMLEDMTSLIENMINKCVDLIDNLVVKEEIMKKHILDTYETAFSQKILHQAIDKGFDRIEVYERLQKLSFQALSEKINLSSLIKEDNFFKSTNMNIEKICDQNKYVNEISILIDKLMTK